MVVKSACCSAAALHTLITIGSPALPDLISASRESVDDVRLGAILALRAIGGRIGSGGVLSLLINLMDRLRSAPPDVLESEIRDFRWFGGASVRVLLVALEDPRIEVRRAASDTLHLIGSEAVPGLVEAISNPEPEVRRRAAAALRQLGKVAVDAILPLIAALGDTAPSVPREASRALTRIGATAVPALATAALGVASAPVRQRAAKILGRIRPPPTEALSALAAAAQDTDSAVANTATHSRSKIQRALAKRGGSQ
jgi:HEAT repeats/PBS lyase HEAT-like repeat